MEITRENPTIADDEGNAEGLGPVVRRFPGRSWVQRQLAFGEHISWVYVGLPIAGSLLFAGTALLFVCVVSLLFGLGIERWLNAVQLWISVGVAALAFIAFYFGLLSRYGHERRSLLAVYFYGIKYGRKSFRFDEIQSVRLGRQPGRFEARLLKLYRWIGIFSPNYRELARMTEAGHAASLGLELRDGRTHWLRGMALAFEPQDFQQFLQLLQTTYPRLFEAQGA